MYKGDGGEAPSYTIMPICITLKIENYQWILKLV